MIFAYTFVCGFDTRIIHDRVDNGLYVTRSLDSIDSITTLDKGNFLPTKTLGVDHYTRNRVDSDSDGSSLWALNAEY